MPNEKADKTHKEKKKSKTKDRAEDQFDPKELKPVRPKVGEDADNLKQREEWFQKRTGRK